MGAAWAACSPVTVSSLHAWRSSATAGPGVASSAGVFWDEGAAERDWYKPPNSAGCQRCALHRIQLGHRCQYPSLQRYHGRLLQIDLISIHKQPTLWTSHHRRKRPTNNPTNIKGANLKAIPNNHQKKNSKWRPSSNARLEPR